MIVRNETANLARCLAALADHVHCWVICDTGSTDGTPEFIRSFFAERTTPGELHSVPFQHFEQARNAALDCAYRSTLDYDYLLLADADMELVVEDGSFRERLEAPGYRLLQRTESGLSYWNTRLVRRGISARYHGVTHEYVDVPGGTAELTGAWYRDHASGSNRVDKFERDINLLSEALEQDPGNHRYWFYLAQSYRDAGRTQEAARAYARRAEMGGWDEEAWNARLQEARCVRRLGDEGGFVRQALTAFNMRPQRAEPLYDLARFYREKGMNDASILFSEAGLGMHRPERDMLFLEDSVYTWGLREEFSIAANYALDPARKDRGFAVCNRLALDRSIPHGSRELAWSNLHFYVEPAVALLPSFAACPIAFVPPADYRAINPSVTQLEGRIVVMQRTVNYEMTEDGLQYQTPGNGPVQTRNFLLQLTEKLEVRSAAEILPPADMPEAVSRLVLGFEDLRVFAWRGALWGNACVREFTAEAWCEQVLARIEPVDSTTCRLTDWRVMKPQGSRLHEKNWMAQVDGDRLQFLYLCDPTRLVDDHGRTVSETLPDIAAPRFRGGSQLISFDGGWLALIHEVLWRPSESRRYYHHRFVWFDSANRLRKLSRPFFFNKKGVEFAAGLAWHPDGSRLLVSYSVADRDSWIATVEAADVRGALETVESLALGAPLSPGQTRAPLKSNLDTGLGNETVCRTAPSDAGTARSARETFLELAPFLRTADDPLERRRLSLGFDRRIDALLGRGSPLPEIHCFYESRSDNDGHQVLTAAMTSMRAAGHSVRLWTYSPHRLAFLRAHGVELCVADDVVPRSLFETIVANSEIRCFSDIFRYAVLYEHGGLWMDCDVILLRPFPFRGDCFLNLQWRGGHAGHFICGNVMYTEPLSRHFRALYEKSIDIVFTAHGRKFGAVGPELLSDYVASAEGAPLRECVFGPMFFNPIDWTETACFEKPMRELADYLTDERTFGIHLWTARNAAPAKRTDDRLISVLCDPLVNFPRLTRLADRFDTDKNRHTGNRHGYARIYDRLLAGRRLSLRRLLEIGLCRGLAERSQPEIPSVALWQSYFPFCQVIGVDLVDFSRFDDERFKSFVCDQSKVEDLRAVAARLEPGSIDVIVDDGSHASYDQQLTLREFFPLLADGGWYFIEDLDWQPPGEDASRISRTKDLLREIQHQGRARSADPLGLSDVARQWSEILFFDSHYEFSRARLLGGLVAIRKRGTVAPFG